MTDTTPTKGVQVPVSRIRVLLADDDAGVREALADLISDESGIELVGVVGDGLAAVEMAQRMRPDVAILDVVMPGGGGIQAARELRDSSPRTKIIGLSSFGDGAMSAAMIKAGAVRYMLKGASAEELLGAIAAAVSGADPDPVDG